MTHVDLDAQEAAVRKFVLLQAAQGCGALLESQGRPVACIFPPPINGDLARSRSDANEACITTTDAQAESEHWKQRCAKLAEERDQLLAEIDRVKAGNEAELKSLAAALSQDARFEMTMAEAYAMVDQDTTLHQLLADLEQEAERLP